MTTVAIYASAYGPRAELSIAVQLDSCRRFAARLGHPAPMVFVDREGMTGDEAQDGLLLWCSCAAGEIDTIIVASRRRFERTPEKVQAALEWAAEEGVIVRFVDEELGLVPDAI